MNGSFSGALLVPTLIESNAGSITLAGKDELFSEATLIGEAGGSQALGGTLTISSGIFDGNGDTLPVQQPSLIVTEDGPIIGGPVSAYGQTALGQPVLGPNGQVASQLGHIVVQSFDGGGFGAINLNGVVQFSGPVSISAGQSISVASGGFLYADGAVSLKAPFVALGTAFLPPTPEDQQIPFQSTNAVLPQYGTGSLTVTAQLIDVAILCKASES